MFCFKNETSLKHIGTQDIVTDRFFLRKFQMEDLNDIYNNWTSDSEAAKYNAWKVHSSINVTKEYLNEWIKQYEKKDYYLWAITDKNTKEVIGSISASNIRNKKLYCEIGYTVSRKYWNKGIATEVLKSILNFLTIKVGFKNIRAYHDVKNIASGKVMQKSGMKYVQNKKQFFLNSEKLVMDCCVYDYKA